MNYNEYIANIKAYRNGTLMQAAPTDALSDWHEKYFDTAVSALSKKMIADHVEHSEDADKFGKDFVSLVAILEEDGVSKQDIGKELEAVSKAAQSQADAAIKKIDSVQHSTDTLEGYQAAIKAYKENHLEHGEWKKHKYIRIENGRYIYPEDVKKSNNPRNSQISGEKYVKNKLDDIATGFKNVAKSVQDYRSEAEAKKAAADAMKAGRTATQQYKESGQYEKDVADEKAKREAVARQEETKKITSLTPEEARKRAAELAGKAQAETPKKESGVGVTVAEKKEGILEKPKGGWSTTPPSKMENNTWVSDKQLEGIVKKLDREDTARYKYNRDIGKIYEEAYLRADGIVDLMKFTDEEIKKMDDLTSEYRKMRFSTGIKEVDDKGVERDKNDAIWEFFNKLSHDKEYKESVEKKLEERISKQNADWDKRHSRSATEEYKKKLEAEKNLKEMARKYAHYADLTKNVNTGGTSTEWSNLVKAAKEYAEETGEDYRKVLERTLEESKKVQHSDPRAAFYAAVDEYKSKKGLNQRVPL